LTVSVFELIKTDFAAYVKRRISYKSAQPVLIGLLSAFAILILYIFVLGFFKKPTDLPPDFYLFMGTYFEDLLLPQIVVLAVWFVSTLKANSDRIREYKFLVSLPVTGQQIFAKFFVADCIRHLWIPTAFVILYFGLLPFASVPFLARPILFAVMFYFFIQSLMVYTHLWVVTKSESSKPFLYIIKLNPVIIILSCLFYEIGQIFFLFAAMDLSSIQFVLINLLSFLLTILLFWRSGRLFLKLHQNSFWHKSWGVEKREMTALSATKLFSNWICRKIRNPFLYKNLLLLMRSNSKLTSSGLTFGFFAIAYLLAMNNTNLVDILNVLLGFLIIYVLLYNVVALNRLNQDEESLKILFSFPTTKSRLYLSMFLPISSWLIFVVFLLTFWLWLKDVTFTLLLSFFFKSLASTIFTVIISINCGLGNYPDLKMAKNRYFIWFILLIIISAIFYKFAFFIALIIFLLTFIELRKLKFFQS